MSSQSQETHPSPHRPVPMQLQPDIKYTIWTKLSDNTTKKLADVFVLSAGNSVKIKDDSLTGGANGTEFWFYTNVSDIVATIESAVALKIDAVQIADDPNFDPTNQSTYEKQSVDNKGQWSQTPATYSSSGSNTCESWMFWSNKPGVGDNAFGVELIVLTAGATRQKVLYGVQWYQYKPNTTAVSGTMLASGELAAYMRLSSPNPYTGAGYFSLQSM